VIFIVLIKPVTVWIGNMLCNDFVPYNCCHTKARTYHEVPYNMVWWWCGSISILFIQLMLMLLLFPTLPCTRPHAVLKQKLPQYDSRQNKGTANQAFWCNGVCYPAQKICVWPFSSKPFCQNSFPKSFEHIAQVSHLSDIVSEILFQLSITDHFSKTTPLPYKALDTSLRLLLRSIQIPYIH